MHIRNEQASENKKENNLRKKRTGVVSGKAKPRDRKRSDEVIVDVLVTLKEFIEALIEDL